ncbi:MAG TPA: NAD(P)-dependent oxidoreductase [Chitinophagales bacterium]|nr:NAD(P)-dependent oxidoreductase [Chitinophagales bacterium]HNM31656.1 NAD(P)-dependent oxidoreductase [Chitinophagales bacterium]
MKKVLITANIHPYLQKRFEELGDSVTVKEDIERSELLAIIEAYEILIITTYTKVDKELIDKARNLKLVGRVGSGMENIDIAYCQYKNISCINSPEGNGNAVGEHSLAMLLNLLNNINKANNELKQTIFHREENRGVELDGKIVGVIGYGHTGSSFAKKLRGFDVEILVYDKYKKAQDNFVKNVSLEELQMRSDIISFHVPYTDETHHYCNLKFLKNCLKTPIIINTSRGAIINTVDMLTALAQHQVAGICIDVFEDEPLTKNKIHPVGIYQQLIANDNVIATPHIAGWTIESKYKLVKILMDKIEKLL